MSSPRSAEGYLQGLTIRDQAETICYESSPERGPEFEVCLEEELRYLTLLRQKAVLCSTVQEIENMKRDLKEEICVISAQILDLEDRQMLQPRCHANGLARLRRDFACANMELAQVQGFEEMPAKREGRIEWVVKWLQLKYHWNMGGR